MPNEFNVYDTTMEIEDHLQAHGVFRNGFSGQPCHSDSYMTLVDFPSLEAAFATSVFSPKNWRDACEYWLTNENMQPPLRLVAHTLTRKLSS
jgi:hypothetical protein